MKGYVNLKKWIAKFLAVVTSFSIFLTMTHKNFEYVNANEETVVNTLSDSLGSNIVKNASDVAAINGIIAEQKQKGALVSEDLEDYGWNEIDGQMRLTAIDWNNTKLRGKISFAGLSELTWLDCRENELTELDVSDNVKLEILNCHTNQLSNLDVSRNVELEELYCSRNKLKNVSLNTKLLYVDLYENELSQLDVSMCTELGYLQCACNRLTDLDISKNKKLGQLICGNNLLSKLDINNNTELYYLSCIANQLSKLDTSKQTELETVYCNDNQLSSLDVMNNTQLRYLICYNNKLTDLDISKNILLENLKCYSNQLDKLDVTNNTELKYLICYNNKITELNITNCKNLNGCENGEKNESGDVKLKYDQGVNIIGSKNLTATTEPTVVPSEVPSNIPSIQPSNKPTETPKVKLNATIFGNNNYTKYFSDKKFVLREETDSDGKFKYKSSNKNVVNITSNGVVNIKGCGEAVIIISVTMTENYNAISKKVKVKVLPDNIQNFKVKALSKGMIKCTWKRKNIENISCQIQYGFNKQFKNAGTFSTKSSLSSGSYTGKGLKKGKIYYVRIKAVAKSDGKSYSGKWSGAVKVKVR